jgi:hypothetical protein
MEAAQCLMRGRRSYANLTNNMAMPMSTKAAPKLSSETATPPAAATHSAMVIIAALPAVACPQSGGPRHS